MSKHINVSVSLVALGLIVENLHYGPHSRFWWHANINKPNNLVLIRVGQKTRVFLNGRAFLVHVVVGNNENPLFPGWVCESGEYSSDIETSSTKAVSSLYSKIFKSNTRYSGHTIIGLDDDNIIQQICQDIHFFPFIIHVEKHKVFVFGIGKSSNSEWFNAGNNFASSIIYPIGKKQSIFISQIQGNKCLLDIYQSGQRIHSFSSISPSDVWKKSGYIQKIDGSKLFGLHDPITQHSINHHVPTCSTQDWNNLDIMTSLYNYHLRRRTISSVKWKLLFDKWVDQESNIIEIYSNLKTIYPARHKFGDREISAWKSFLKAAGCSNITPFESKESKVNSRKCKIKVFSNFNFNIVFYQQFQFWTKSSDPTKDKNALLQLYKAGFLVPTPIHMPTKTKTFWNCMDRTLKDNNKSHDGKRRILSIIADQFTYAEIESNLKVSCNYKQKKYHFII